MYFSALLRLFRDRRVFFSVLMNCKALTNCDGHFFFFGGYSEKSFLTSSGSFSEIFAAVLSSSR